MQELSVKIEVEAKGISSTFSPLTNANFTGGKTNMAFQTISKICSVEGCETKPFGHGFCNKHYKRWRRWGDPTLRRTRQICIIPDCDAYQWGQGYCQKHYARFRKHGSPFYEIEVLSETNQKPFWEKVAITTNPDECWEWLLHRCHDYGHVSFQGRTMKAHRVAYFFTHGTWPLVVRHTCDNPPCCNPNHLLGGTVADNNRDRMERGRQRRGENMPLAKLTDANVREIRRRVVNYSTGVGKGSPNSKKALAKEFGVTRRLIYMVVTNQIWRHVK